jgi:AcrR family transcriptional regulator
MAKAPWNLTINLPNGRLTPVKTLDPVLHRIRKEAILQQARHMFATKGFAETSMDDIAHANHMQKPSLYHYFRSKQQILEEMMQMEAERWAEQLKDTVPESNFKEGLLRIGTAFLLNLEDPARREFFQIIHFESHKNPEIFKAFKESPICKGGPIYQLFVRHLEERLSRVQIAMALTQFMGGLIHYATIAKMRGENMCLEKFSDAEYLEQSVNIFLKGLESA